MRSITFFIHGEPAPQGSKKYVGNGRFVESSKKVAPWREAVAKAVSLLGEWEQFTNPVEVTATFYLRRPPSVKRALPSVAPDLDKLQRSLGDGLSINARNDEGVTFLADDSLIVKWNTKKYYADTNPMGADVTITEVDEVPMAILDTPKKL